VRLGVVDLDGQGDRLKDALAIMKRLEEEGLVAYLARSWTNGRFHVWLFFGAWLPAGKVRRFLKAVLESLNIVGEVRPSGEPSGDGPGQSPIALPFFGAFSPLGPNGRCPIIDPDNLAPLPLEYFLEHMEQNAAPPELRPAKRVKGPWRPGPSPAVSQLEETWPSVGEGEAHLSKTGKLLGGRDDAAISHAGELMARGIRGPEALEILERWDAQNRPPLGRDCLLEKLERAERYQKGG